MGERYKVKACPKCGDSPTPFVYDHDKENRSMNHLRWGLVCSCGACRSRGGNRREVIDLHNEARAAVRQEVRGG